MQVQLLGPPLVVTTSGEHVVRGTKQAGLLALLALRAGHVVPLDSIVTTLWSDSPPPTVRNTVQAHVSGLRRLLGRDAVVSTPAGYRLALADGGVDATVFADLADRAHDHARSGDWHSAHRVYAAALAMWRGPALAGLDGGWFDGQRQALHERRLEVVRGRWRSELRLGRHLIALQELAGLCEEEPFDEELWALLMLARYRAGQLVESLATYRRVRERLVEELGVEPGAELRDLHAAVLRRDPALDVDPTTAAAPSGAAPARLGRLWGRAADLSRLGQLVTAGEGPVTLVGPPGVGKSRLAAELVRRLQGAYADGAAVVDLESLGSLADVAARAVDELGLSAHGDPHERLRTCAGLLVLDGVYPDHPDHQQLLDLVATLDLPVVATAHRPCGWAGEQVHPVRPLPTVGDGEVPAAATELLLARAAAAGADVAADDPDAAACARLLDGIPLALELAAPRAVLGLAELRADLERERAAGRAGVRLSYAASLRGRDDPDRDLLRVLARCAGPVDAAWLTALPRRDPTATSRSLAALLRDGLVRQRPGSHGRPMYELLSGVRPEILAESGAAPTEQVLRDVVTTHAAALGRHGQAPSVLDTIEFAQRVGALAPAAEGALEAGLELGLAEECVLIARSLSDRSFVVRPALLGGAWRVLTTPDTWRGLTDATRISALAGASVWSDHDGRPAEMAERADALVEETRRQGAPGSIAEALASHVILCAIHGLECSEDPREALRLADLDGSPLVRATVMVRVGVVQGLDVARRGVDLAREAGHVGALSIGLYNLAESHLATGDPGAAARCAVEAAGLFAAMHLSTLQEASSACLATARALTGSGRDLRAVADMAEAAWQHDDLRTSTDTILKLACGLRACGAEDWAARAVGLYQERLAAYQLPVSTEEQALLDQWLVGVPATPATGRLQDAMAEVVAAARALPDAPDAIPAG